MLNVYRKFVVYTLDGERVCGIDNRSTIVLLESNEAIETEEKWCDRKNIEKALETELPLFYGYTIIHKYLYMRNENMKKFRVWKNSVLKKKVSYRAENISLDELLKLRCSDKVIQYLKERGITICPMKA